MPGQLLCSASGGTPKKDLPVISLAGSNIAGSPDEVNEKDKGRNPRDVIYYNSED